MKKDFTNKIKNFIDEKVSEIIKTKPQNDSEYNELGLYYFKQKKYDLALENFNKAISIKNDNDNYYKNRAYCYYEMKQFELGDADFNMASIINEITTALNGYGADRFTNWKAQERYKETLIKYKEHPIFAERIRRFLDIYPI